MNSSASATITSAAPMIDDEARRHDSEATAQPSPAPHAAATGLRHHGFATTGHVRRSQRYREPADQGDCP
jgi:hypothetical protein